MFDSTNTYISFDLIELGVLPENWDEQIINLAKANAYYVKLDGKSSTSREPHDTEGVEVFVVEGDVIAEKLNWLDELYKSIFLDFANSAFKNEYVTAENLKSGVNINLLRGINARYEWHVDSNPLTGVLFVTTHIEKDGGELIFKLLNETLIIYPKKGTLILFDAREIPHTVLPLKKNNIRVSVPLNFYSKGQVQIRPDDLDSYIYKNQNP